MSKSMRKKKHMIYSPKMYFSCRFVLTVHCEVLCPVSLGAVKRHIAQNTFLVRQLYFYVHGKSKVFSDTY